LNDLIFKFRKVIDAELIHTYFQTLTRSQWTSFILKSPIFRLSLEYLNDIIETTYEEWSDWIASNQQLYFKRCLFQNSIVTLSTAYWYRIQSMTLYCTVKIDICTKWPHTAICRAYEYENEVISFRRWSHSTTYIKTNIIEQYSYRLMSSLQMNWFPPTCLSNARIQKGNDKYKTSYVINKFYLLRKDKWVKWSQFCFFF
jgi:hypothetical protein